MPSTSFKLLPGSHFYIKGMGSFGNDAAVPIEIDLGETLDWSGHAIYAVVIRDSIRKGIIKALETGRWRRIESAPSRQAGPGLIKINGGS